MRRALDDRQGIESGGDWGVMQPLGYFRNRLGGMATLHFHLGGWATHAIANSMVFAHSHDLKASFSS